MSWTTPGTVTVGQVLTAAFENAHVLDDLAYLHGDAGPFDLADGPVLPNAKHLWGKDGGGTARRMIGMDAVSLHLDPDVVTGVKASGLHVQRRGDNVFGHMEGGTVSLAAGAATAISFVDTFALAPRVWAHVQDAATGVLLGIVSVTTTGFTLKNNGGSTLTIAWEADGIG